MKNLLPLLLALCMYAGAGAQSYPAYQLPDTSQFGQHIAHSMNLLQHSNPDSKRKVRVLIYGQSISEQDWWLEVRNDLQTRFPNADLDIRNLAIGGFSSQYLWRTVDFDVRPFYPDLVIFYVYGSHIDYGTIIKDIRRFTTAEIAIQTEHYTKEDSWSDKMSYEYLPEYAQIYHCELITVRDEWKDYLSENSLAPSALLKDAVHLNNHGNYLMAEIVKPYLRYDSEWEPDPDSLTTEYVEGEDFQWNADTLLLAFAGNRLDVVFGTLTTNYPDSLEVYVDNQLPSVFQGCYHFTRPYDDQNHCFPWCMGTMFQLENHTSLLDEVWTCHFTKVQYSGTTSVYFEFEVSGSKTGYDGSGNSTSDFLSNSGRIFIGKDDWHLLRSLQVSGTSISAGYEVMWKTALMANDKLKIGPADDADCENAVTLFQGIPNTPHILRLIKQGAKPPITCIRAYRPTGDREKKLRLEVSSQNHTSPISGDTFAIEIQSNTWFEVKQLPDWVTVDRRLSSGDVELRFFVAPNPAAFRSCTLTMAGNGVPEKNLTISQEGSNRTNMIQPKNRFRLYPQPTSDVLHVALSPEFADCRLGVFDLSGCFLHQGQLNAEGTALLDLHALPSGIYFLRLIGETPHPVRPEAIVKE